MPHPHRPRRRVPAPLLLAVALALTLSACGGGGPTGPDATKSPGPQSGSSSATQQPPPPPQPRLGMPGKGQCSRLTYPQSTSAVAGARSVPCRRQHNAVVAHAGLVPQAITAQTPAGRRRAVAAKVCEPAFRRVVGGSPELRAASLLTWVFYTPSAAQLEKGARWVRCDVIARSGRELVPLPDARPLLARGLPDQLRVCQDRRGRDVSCARPHQFRVEATFAAPGNAYPGASFTAVARDRCGALLEGRLGYWQPPSRTGWAAGDRFVRCLVRRTA